jgi:hypothetical protein
LLLWLLCALFSIFFYSVSLWYLQNKDGQKVYPVLEL